MKTIHIYFFILYITAAGLLVSAWRFSEATSFSPTLLGDLFGKLGFFMCAFLLVSEAKQRIALEAKNGTQQ